MADRVRLSPSARAGIQSDGRLDVLLALEEQDHTTTELARQLGRSRAAIVHHLRALIDAGLVQEVGSEPISGGLLRTYGAVGAGWADAIATLNKLAEQ